jgi:hypothetical protein
MLFSRAVTSPFNVGLGAVYGALIHHMVPSLGYHMAEMYLKVLKIYNPLGL